MPGAEIQEPHTLDDILVRLFLRDLPPVQIGLDHRIEILERVGRSMILQGILSKGARELILMNDDVRLAEILNAACMIAVEMREHHMFHVVRADAHHVEAGWKHALLTADMGEEFLQTVNRPAPIRTAPVRMASGIEQDVAVGMFDVIGGDGNIDDLATRVRIPGRRDRRVGDHEVLIQA